MASRGVFEVSRASDSSRAAASSRACADRSCSYSANAPAICCRIARRVASDASSSFLAATARFVSAATLASLAHNLATRAAPHAGAVAARLEDEHWMVRRAACEA